MQGTRRLFDQWTALTIAGLFTLSVYPVFASYGTPPLQAYVWNLLLISVFVVGAQLLYRFLFRPIPAKYKLGVLTRRLFALSILTGAGIDLYNLIQKVSGPAYTWTGGFGTANLVTSGLFSGLVIAVSIGALKLVIRYLGYSFSGTDPPESTRATDQITEHFDAYVPGIEILSLPDSRWISRRRLLGIRWFIYLPFLSALGRTETTPEWIGTVIAIFLLYTFLLWLLSQTTRPTSTATSENVVGPETT